MPYSAEKPGTAPDTQSLRERIPGWGADLDPADRPAVPREQPGIVTGAHWDVPADQPVLHERERSVEHARMTPVFGTAQPLHGISGWIRGYAYAAYSEGRTAHWLLLVLGDRVDAVASHLRSLLTRRPDDPVTESGVSGERGRHPIASRLRPGRLDVRHSWMDPILVVGPWIAAGLLVFQAGRLILRALSGPR
jgi:hypothetical protein